MKTHYDRRPRTGIMLAYPFDEKRLVKWDLPWLVQPKYNGVRCIAIRSSTQVCFLSSTGLPILTVPHVERAVMNLPLGIYDGELYLHNNFQKLTSLVLRNDVVEGHEEVRYIIFDTKMPTIQKFRLLSLYSLQPLIDPSAIELAPWWAGTTMHDLEEILAEQMALGYEGIILREHNAGYVEKRTTTMMKLKPRRVDTYRIMDTLEEISIHGEPKGRLGAFIVTDADGQQQFKVGSGFTAAQRDLYWQARESMPGRLVNVKYQALTDRGVPWFPVFVEVMRP